jgi:hypothetical protein
LKALPAGGFQEAALANWVAGRWAATVAASACLTRDAEDGEDNKPKASSKAVSTATPGTATRRVNQRDFMVREPP